MTGSQRHSMPQTMDKFQRFEAWLKDNGARFDVLELRQYDTPAEIETAEEKKEPTTLEESEMRGVHARTHIPPDTICMIIPRRCLITVEMGQATPLGQKILNSDLDLDAPKHIFLMIYILWDRKVNGVNSFFHPYYEILPRTLKNMPIFWSPDELKLLTGSYLLDQIADRNEAIADDYYAICQVAPELEEVCTLDEFKWARMCVCSRNFGLQIDGHRTSALVPHADMLNHYRPRETKWTFEEERQAFTITTLQGIPAGAQVYDSYGQKCNHRFLLNYGFAVEDNREMDGFCPNEVPIQLSVNPNDPLYLSKVKFWTRGEAESLHAAVAGFADAQSLSAAIDAATKGKEGDCNGVSPIKRVRVCISNNENTRLLFSLLRAIACNDEELKAITTSVNDGAVSRALFGMSDQRTMQVTPTFYRSCRDIRHPISLRNEKAAMTLLQDIVSHALAQYPTTLAQDIVDLMDEVAFPRFSNHRHAKIQVRGEKDVLHHFALWAHTALDVMDVIESEMKGVDRSSYDSVIAELEAKEGNNVLHHTIVRYCDDVLGSLRREEWKNIRRRTGTKLSRDCQF